MMLHARFKQVQEAKAQFGLQVIKLVTEHDLTAAEIGWMLLTTAMEYNRIALRQERHPKNPDKGADEA